MIIYFSLSAAIAQSVERRIGSAEVTGPIPVSSLTLSTVLQCFFCIYHRILYSARTGIVSGVTFSGGI